MDLNANYEILTNMLNGKLVSRFIFDVVPLPNLYFEEAHHEKDPMIDKVKDMVKK